MANEEDQISRRRPPRFRYLIDITILVAVTFFLDAVLGFFVQAPINLQIGFVLDTIGKVLLIGVASALIWLRAEKLADIGLKSPANWLRTILMAIVFAAVLFVATLPPRVSVPCGIETSPARVAFPFEVHDGRNRQPQFLSRAPTIRRRERLPEG